MKVVIQRCNQAEVIINNCSYNKIKKGYCLFVGFNKSDTIQDLEYIVKKIINLRIFSDEAGKLNKSILDINGEILSISQFTLYADTNSGNRPSFTESMPYNEAKDLYEKFNDMLKTQVNVYSGIFGSDMQINLVNDGPVTIILDSKNKKIL